MAAWNSFTDSCEFVFKNTNFVQSLPLKLISWMFVNLVKSTWMVLSLLSPKSMCSSCWLFLNKSLSRCVSWLAWKEISFKFLRLIRRFTGSFLSCARKILKASKFGKSQKTSSSIAWMGLLKITSSSSCCMLEKSSRSRNSTVPSNRPIVILLRFVNVSPMPAKMCADM